MKVLCFARPWNKKQMRFIGESLGENFPCKIISNFKSIDEVGLASGYYKSLKRYDSNSCDLSDDYKEIIKRCRLLRSLKASMAKKHIESMKESIKRVFDEEDPDLIISQTIDNFVMDLIYRESSERSIQFVGLVPSFVNGYYRQTAMGEYFGPRKVDEFEVDDFLKTVSLDDYAPSFTQKAQASPSFEVSKRWFKNMFRPAYFFILRYLSGDRYNSNYWGGQKVSLQWLHYFPRLYLGKRNWRERLEKSGKLKVYIPLQHVPEATVDYWCKELDVIDYDAVIISLLDKFKDDFSVVIKEHPNVLGLRNPRLYKKILDYENVVFCPTFEVSNEVARLCDAVLVWTGSVGFEAALRGKPVLTLTKPYYFSGDRFKKISLSTPNDDIEYFIKSTGLREVTTLERRAMASYLLAGLWPGKFNNDGSWCVENDVDVKEAGEIGRKVRLSFIDS